MEIPKIGGKIGKCVGAFLFQTCAGTKNVVLLDLNGLKAGGLVRIVKFWFKWKWEREAEKEREEVRK